MRDMKKNRPLVDTSWWQNDGVVNTNSMIAPSSNVTVNNNESLQIGKWNHIETKANWGPSRHGRVKCFRLVRFF